MRLWQSVLEGIVIGVAVLAALQVTAPRAKVTLRTLRVRRAASAAIGIGLILLAGVWWSANQPKGRVVYQAHDCGVPDPAGSFDPWQQSCMADPHITILPACGEGQAPDPSDGTRCVFPSVTSQP